VFGIGPQFGYVFPLSQDLQGYINVKAYGEFGNSARPAGWNTWLTFVISPGILTMSGWGQNAKYSETAINFRFAPMNGHHQART